MDQTSIRQRQQDGVAGRPWRADRPAIAFYSTLASDGRLDSRIRSDASLAAAAIGKLVLAHAESAAFGPSGGAIHVLPLSAVFAAFAWVSLSCR